MKTKPRAPTTEAPLYRQAAGLAPFKRLQEWLNKTMLRFLEEEPAKRSARAGQAHSIVCWPFPPHNHGLSTQHHSTAAQG